MTRAIRSRASRGSFELLLDAIWSSDGAPRNRRILVPAIAWEEDPSPVSIRRRPNTTAALFSLLIPLSYAFSAIAEPRGEISGASAETSSPSLARLRERSSNWPIHPHDAEHAFTYGPLRIVENRPTQRGLSGARRVVLDLPDHELRVKAKWKPVPARFDGVNNSPRRELAAYEVQKLFLDPENYVVPTSAMRCLSSGHVVTTPGAPGDDGRFQGTLPGTMCQLGLLSLWLERVDLPEKILDLDRFDSDSDYARHRADFNLTTYLIKHLDGRRGNILVSTSPNDPRVFAIDNGVAFGGFFYNWFVPNWSKIRVPALRRESIDRLRALEFEDLQALGVIAQLEIQPNGDLMTVAPTLNLDADDGVRFEEGTIQFGLDEDEIEDLWGRIEDILEDVDEGDIPLF
jgi:hypothetical protein